MKEFVLGNNRVLIDVDRTRAYYDIHDELLDGCDCAYCRNFRAAVPYLPGAVADFLTSLGLTLERAAEIMEWCKEEDGRHWYTVQYHLAGELLEQGETPLEIAPEVTAGFTVGSGPFLEDFPEPFFQLFLDIHLPWLLEKQND